MTTGADQYTDEFLFAKLHARWSGAVVGARLEELVRASGEASAFRRALEAFGLPSTELAAMPPALHRRCIADLGQVRDLAGDGGAFYDAFIGRYFFENLKLLLRHRAKLLSAKELDYLLVEGPGLPPLRLDVLLEAQNTKLFHRALPPGPYTKALLPILAEFDAKPDLFLADTRLERLFFHTLVAAAESAPPGMRESAVKLARLEAEIFNLVTVLRNLDLYHLPPEILAELLAEDGLLLSAQRLQELAGAADSARLIRQLPERYAKVLTPLAGQPLPVRAAALWELLDTEALRTFRDFRDAGASIAVYPFLKQQETLGLIRLCEGARMGKSIKDKR